MAKPKRSNASKSKTAAKAAPAAASKVVGNNPQADTNRTLIYNLTTQPDDWNIVYDGVSLLFHGKPLLTDASIRLVYGQRYALTGSNGCGKSVLLRAIASGEFQFPRNYDYFLLDSEYPACDKTPLEAVTGDVELEIEQTSERLSDAMGEDDPDDDLIELLEARLSLLTSDDSEARACRILVGLGFNDHDLRSKPTRELSGGWRMRVSLARALFVQPALLLLDGPTQHLDLDSVLYLERELCQYSGTIILTSHSADFLDNVATAVILMRENKLHYFSGDFSSYLMQRDSMDARTARLYEKQQRVIERYTDFITRYGQSSKQLSRQAQSRQKQLDRMMDTAISKTLLHDKEVDMEFIDPRPLPPPVIAFRDVAFKYETMVNMLYTDVNLGVNQGDVIIIMGANGSGKSTLLKLLRGSLQPCEGDIRMHSHCTIAQFNQHFRDELPGDASPLEFFQQQFKHITDEQIIRKMLGRFGIAGDQQTVPISKLSDGNRVRIAMSLVCYQEASMLCLDEPSNGMDLATIDGLAKALAKYKGCAVLVSHDFRLIGAINDQIEALGLESDKRLIIWDVDHITRTVKVFRGDILEYKAKMMAEVMERIGFSKN